MTKTNEELADYALLALYAWDQCDKEFGNPNSGYVDPRISAAGWKVIGQLLGADDSTGAGSRIKTSVIRPGDTRQYGFLAVNIADPLQYVVVIRGTDGAQEWFDDFEFESVEITGGRVVKGFHDIYKTLTLRIDGFNSEDFIINDLIDFLPSNSKITVVGHSLGSALGVYLFNDLDFISLIGYSCNSVSGVFFACPKTGDFDFVSCVCQTNSNDYIVVNYEKDVVPKVPPGDLFHLDIYRQLPKVQILQEIDQVKINPDLACCHHLMSYIALLSPTKFIAASQDVQATEKDVTDAKCVLLNVEPIKP